MKTSWSGLQTERLAVIDLCRGPFGRLTATIGLTIGLGSVMALAVYLLIGLSAVGLALALVGIALGLATAAGSLYINYLINQPTYLISASQLAANRLNGFDFGLLRVINNWRARPSWRGLFSALLADPEAGMVMYRMGVNQATLAAMPDSTAMTDEEIYLWLKAIPAKVPGGPVSTVYDFLAVLFASGWDDLLNDLALKRPSVQATIAFYRSQARRRWQYRRFWLHPVASPGLAADFVTGYTTLLDRSTRRLTADQAWLILQQPLFGRSELINQAQVMLNKTTDANLLLIGQDGVGRRSLLIHLAALIARGQTNTPLDGCQIRFLTMGTLLAAGDQLDQLVNQLSSEIIRAGNVVLVIEDLDLILDPREPVEHRLTEILIQYLDNPQIRLLASTTPVAYGQFIEPNPALAGHFEIIEVAKPSPDALVDILLDHLPVIENRYRTFFPLATVSTVIKLADRYLKNFQSPRRELDLIEETAATAHAADQSIISQPTVEAVVERLAKVPIVGSTNSRRAALNMTVELSKVIIGQSSALAAIAAAMERSGAGLNSGSRPIGSFLFLGPTGVGKTETAKQLARLYFQGPGENRLVRLDLGEFADSQGLAKLLGREAVSDPGVLMLALEENPSAVVLLDELDKASDSVRNALLPLLDEGRLTTNFGRVLDLTNTIVIATSNAGSALIKERIEAGRPITDKELIDRLIADGHFSPELLNRFDAVVVFRPLTLLAVKEIVKLRLQELSDRLWQAKQLRLSIESSVIDELARLGYDPVFGARALDRVIKDKLETAIAKEILANQPKAGSTIKISNL